MNKNNLKEELQPYYEESDCCSSIVELRKSNVEKDKEIERLNNIIKEVREYIDDNIKGNHFKRYDDDIYKACDDILEILDKEDNV